MRVAVWESTSSRCLKYNQLKKCSVGKKKAFKYANQSTYTVLVCRRSGSGVGTVPEKEPNQSSFLFFYLFLYTPKKSARTGKRARTLKMYSGRARLGRADIWSRTLLGCTVWRKKRCLDIRRLKRNWLTGVGVCIITPTLHECSANLG